MKTAKRFFRNPTSVLGLILVVMFVVVAVAAAGQLAQEPVLVQALRVVDQVVAQAVARKQLHAFA